MILGVDPSQRNTGLCLLPANGSPEFLEIKTDTKEETLDVLSSGRMVHDDVLKFMAASSEQIVAIGMEKQLSIGGHMSALQFFMQMKVLEAIQEYGKLFDPPGTRPAFVFPLPVQVKSYYVKRFGGKAKEATLLSRDYVKSLLGRKRISKHLCDAYFLAVIAGQVLNKRWSYKLPGKEARLIPWEVENGE
jgi:hypothetical protein